MTIHAQGKPRKLPDGWLHLWNYAATKSSGMAGAVLNHIVDERQKEIVERVLIQRAIQVEKDLADNNEEYTQILSDSNHPKRQVRYESKHQCWRFRKAFLKEHFGIAVYSSMYACGRNTAALASFEINREYVRVVRSNKLVASAGEIELHKVQEARLIEETTNGDYHVTNQPHN